jgi:hypothetical protein
VLFNILEHTHVVFHPDSGCLWSFLHFSKWLSYTPGKLKNVIHTLVFFDHNRTYCLSGLSAIAFVNFVQNVFDVPCEILSLKNFSSFCRSFKIIFVAFLMNHWLVIVVTVSLTKKSTYCTIKWILRNLNVVFYFI